MNSFNNINNSIISSDSWSSHVTNTVKTFTEGKNDIHKDYPLHMVYKNGNVKQSLLNGKTDEVYNTGWKANNLDDDILNNTQSELRKKSREIHEVLKQTSSGHMSVKTSSNKKSATSAFETQDTSSVEGRQVSDIKGRHLKYILLVPDRRSLTGNESSGVEIFRKLFGITIFEYNNNGKAKWNPSAKDRKLVVQDVVEGSISHMAGMIHRGDMLVCINEVDVTWHNFPRLLHSLQKRDPVKLTFQSPKIVGPKPSSCIFKIPGGDICSAVLGKRLSQIQIELSQFKCVAMFLTLIQSSADKEEDNKDDIIYLFPHEEENLSALRGLFITLCSFLVDVVDQPATCSNLTFSDGGVNVAYKQCGRDVLVFAVPEDRVTSSTLLSMIEAFVSLMILLFQDVKSAFIDCDGWWVDKVLALMFHQALGLSPTTCMTFTDYHSVKLLSLSHENQLLCDEILTELESMDFDNFLDSKDIFSSRQFSILGTSLFYKDYLLCSHLLPQQQRHLNLFMNCHELFYLSLKEDVNDVVIWQEMKLYSLQDISTFPMGYRPSKSTSFLMIIGKMHYYLAAVLEGVSLLGANYPPKLFVNQARATLDQLETEDVHMSTCCEERLNSLADGIFLSSAEQLCVSTPRSRSASRHQRLSSSSKSAADTFFLSRSKSADRMEKDLPNLADLTGAVMMRRQGSKLSYGSNDSGGSSNSTGPPRSKGSRVSSVTDLSGIMRSQSVYHIETPLDIFKNARLSRGKDNTLLSYVQLDSGNGIIITPTEAELNEVHSSLQDQVMINFNLACQKIRAVFLDQVVSADTKSFVFNTDTMTEKSCVEAGAMFQCTYQSPATERRQLISTLSYWVVGRCWQSTRQEIYVCFHESAKQSTIEMAFSLGFGS
ncbi:hypothetical protein Btru_066145 [Bulinus truncatus]|nr:hypothetical protein Btru_066145 [Bulinus truncatus]